MRVCLLSNYPVPYQMEFLDAVRRLPDLELKALFLSPKDPTRSWPAIQAMDGLWIVPSVGVPGLPQELRFHPQLVPFLLRERPDIVVVCGYSHVAFQLAIGAMRIAGRPFVIWAEAPRLAEGTGLTKAIRQALLRPLREAKAVLAVGQHAIPQWESALPTVPVFNHPYSCDISRYLRIERSSKRDTFTFLFSGQLIERKGVDTLLRAFALAAREQTNLRLVLIGEGSRKAQLAGNVPENIRARVEFRGFVPWEQLPAVYAEADALVVPSRYDGWALVVNEALAAGLPVIASRAVGAALEYVRDGVTGFLVNVDDEVGLSTALLETVSQAPTMSACARAVGKTLGPDVAAARFDRLLRRVSEGVREPWQS